MGTLAWIAVGAVLLVLVWKGRRRQSALASAVAVGLAIIAVPASLIRACRAVRPETPVVPWDIHFAIGARLGELARERLPAATHRVLIIRPHTDHPAHRRIVDTQEAGVRRGLAGSGVRVVVETIDLRIDVPIPLSVPRIEPTRLREWAARHGPLGAIVSLAGAPKITAADRHADIPPLIALSFTDPRDLRWAFQHGWLAVCVYQIDSGRDLDVSRLSAREIVERVCEVVTLDDARAGRIRWRP